MLWSNACSNRIVENLQQRLKRLPRKEVRKNLPQMARMRELQSRKLNKVGYVTQTWWPSAGILMSYLMKRWHSIDNIFRTWKCCNFITANKRYNITFQRGWKWSWCGKSWRDNSCTECAKYALMRAESVSVFAFVELVLPDMKLWKNPFPIIRQLYTVS